MYMNGTSMASPATAGAAALLFQANPSLTPGLVKTILQHTAEAHADYDTFTQGAGFLDARAAVTLAQSIASGAVLESAPVVSSVTIPNVEMMSDLNSGSTWAAIGRGNADDIVWAPPVIRRQPRVVNAMGAWQ